MEDMIIQLQETLAHQGEEILRLSEELYTQQGEIANLHEQYKKLESKYLAVLDDNRNIDQDVPPPHY